MPPSVGRKKATSEKEDAERRKQILSAKEKILKIKRIISKIVETMLEESVPVDYFLKNCVKLCQADYNDVIQERSIEHICGYPLCSNIIKQVIKQQYHISRATNKVYDLSERKFFCSNECYKASNFVRAQLSPIPLYMRKEEHITINLLSDCDNKGSAGEEVILHHILSEKDIEHVCSENVSSSTLSNILHDEIKQCADSLKDLKIKENVYENPFVFESPAKSEETKFSQSDDECSNSDSENEASENDKYFPNYDNVTVLSRKLMPVPEKTKKAVLIPPLKPNVTVSSLPANLSLDFLSEVFQDWMTEDSLKYLLGEKQVYSLKADFLFKKMINSGHADSEKLSAVKNEYINLCLKLDKLEDDEVNESADFGDTISQSDEVKSGNKLTEPISGAKAKAPSLKNIPKKKTKKKSKGKNKTVTFASNIDESQSMVKPESTEFPQESLNHEPLPDPTFPLVDSVSQNALRRQVLIKQLKSVLSNILPHAEFHYRDVRDAVIRIVDTFSLTPTNIIFKPKEWKLIAVVLFRILTKTVLQDLHEETKFLKLCECIMIPSARWKEIEDLVSDIISPEQLHRIQGIV